MRRLLHLLPVVALAAVVLVLLSRPSSASSGSYLNLQLYAPSSWHLYTEGPSGYWINVSNSQVTDNTVPAGVGSTCFDFHISSSSSYANAYYYQTLSQVPSTSFEYTLWYKFTSNGQIAQAYEFPLNQYEGGKRYQLAMQYLPNSDGQGYRWRVWGGAALGWLDKNPSTGQSWGFTQNLAANTWHSIALYGNVSGGTVNYTTFWSDGVKFTINHSFNPDADRYNSNMVVPAYQVDNNTSGDEQDVHISNWSVYWF